MKYEPSKEFETQINVRAQGGNPPDIAIFPQPGLFAAQVDGGYIKKPAQAVVDNAKKFWSEDWQKYGTVKDEIYGAPLMASVKGYVWYSPTDVRGQGLEVPTTLDELADPHQDIAGRRQGRQAVVRRLRAPATRPAGRAPTGSRTSCSASPAPTSTTSG